MNKKIIFIAIGLGVFLLIFGIIPSVIQLTDEQRDGLALKNGISIFKSEHISIEEVYFTVIVNEKPQSIFVEFTPVFTNSTKPGLVGIILPYPGHIKNEHDEWTIEKINSYQILSKKYQCSKESQCVNFNEQNIKFELSDNLDSKDNYRHGIKLKFNQITDKVVFEYISKNLIVKNNLVMFNENSKSYLTLILDESADYFNITPKPESVSLEKNYEIGNTYFNWKILGTEIFLISYEIPQERIESERVIAVNSILGLGIAFAAIVLAIYAGMLSKKDIENLWGEINYKSGSKQVSGIESDGIDVSAKQLHVTRSSGSTIDASSIESNSTSGSDEKESTPE